MTAMNRTASDMKAESIAKMGDDLGALYHELWQEVAWLHNKWREYVLLFGTKPSRIDLLNEAAPVFFRIVQDALWEDVLLHIARLTDSAQTNGKPNLSFRRLPNVIGHAEKRAEIEAGVQSALTQSEFCRDWRNRRIAHRDLKLSLGQGADPLLPASRELVRKALRSLVDLLNVVATHYLGSTTYFDVGPEPGGAETLLYVLDDGIKAHKTQQDRLLSGIASAEDWKPRDL